MFEDQQCLTNKPQEKYQNKYRIKSARKYGYDYGLNGWYFVTIKSNLDFIIESIKINNLINWERDENNIV